MYFLKRIWICSVKVISCYLIGFCIFITTMYGAGGIIGEMMVNKADVVYLSDVKDRYESLQKFSKVLHDTLNLIEWDQIRTGKMDTMFRGIKEGEGIMKGSSYWIKLVIHNRRSDSSSLENWYLDLGNINYADVYILDSNRVLSDHLIAGSYVPAGLKQLKYGNRNTRIQCSIKYESMSFFYIRLQQRIDQSTELSISLSKEDPFILQEGINGQNFDYLFIGLLAALILFNFIFSFITKELIYIYLGLFISADLVFMLDIMHVISEIPGLKEYPRLYEPISLSSILFINFGYLQFFKVYFKEELSITNWKRWIDYSVLINCVFMPVIILFVYATSRERMGSIMVAIFAAAQYLFLLFPLGSFMKFDNPKTKYISYATLCIVIGVLVNGTSIAFGWGAKPEFTKLAIIGNISFFFMGLAFRFNNLLKSEIEAEHQSASNEMKRRFYNNVTHEFRTPITLVKGMVGQIEKQTDSRANPEVRTLFDISKNQLDYLLKLVNDLLDIAKLDAGKMKLSLEEGDFIAYTQYVFRSFDSLAISKKVHLVFLTEIEELMAFFDKEKMRQIFSNLISNAIKFSSQGGKVILQIKMDDLSSGRYVQIKLSDNGSGIPEKELEHIFEPFFQLEGARVGGPGTGLGLALVRDFVRLMDGKIEVTSKRGEGSCFELIFPLTNDSCFGKNTDGTKVVHEGNHDEGSTRFEEDVADKAKEAFSRSAQLPVTQIPSNFEKPLLLVVDDHQEMVYYFKLLLETRYRIEMAYDGKMGLELATELVPDVIVSDVKMPEMNGLDFCKAIKADPVTCHIPFIMVSARVSDEDRIEGLSTGADAYLAKPFDEHQLNLTISNLLQFQKATQDRIRRRSESALVEGEEHKQETEDSFLVSLNTLMAEHLDDEDFGILQVCRAMRLSRTQLHRKITALTGESSSIYIRNLRLSYALKYLKTTQLTVSEIAYKVGFRDPNYFTRCFVEKFEKTPSEIRKLPH